MSVSQDDPQNDAPRSYYYCMTESPSRRPTLRIDGGSGHEDEVAGPHLVLRQHDGQGVDHVGLVPRSQAEAEVSLEVAHHLANQPATVQEERGLVLQGWEKQKRTHTVLIDYLFIYLFIY